jgi:uncharacterized membrane protein YbhN (UPF0104 family)
LARKQNRVLLLLIKLSISSFLLYLVLSKSGFEKVLSTLKDISIPSFIGAMLLYLFAQFISSIRWKLLLPGTIRVRKLFSLYLIGSFFSNLLPGVIGGDAVKGFYLYQMTKNASLSLASIFMDRYIGFIVLLSICTLAFPFGFTYFQGSRIGWIFPLIVLSFIVASFLIFGLRIGKRIKIISTFYDYFHTYRNQKKIIAKAMLLSEFVQLSAIISVNILALGFGQKIPVLASFIFIPLTVMFTTVPISISGIGVREGAFVLFLGLIDVKPEVATAISLSWFLSIATSNLLGLVEYLRYKKETPGNLDLQILTNDKNQKMKE